jgi:hypothetical protein
MKQPTLTATLLFAATIFSFGPNYAGAETTVFGPEKYSRETGKPRRLVERFSIPDPSGEFALVVRNGEGNRGKVSSAIVELNGLRVIGPNAFNKHADLITKPVTLKEQNELAVEVRSQPGSSVIVAIVRTGTSQPSPISGIIVDPDGFPIDTPTQVTFSASVPYPPGGLVPTVELEEITQDGDVIAVEGPMVDNGDLSIGDEIQGDGVFSLRKTYNVPERSEILLRVRVEVNGQLFYSDPFSLTVFTPISAEEVDAINDAQLRAERLYYELLPDRGKDQALTAVIDFMKSLSFVADAGVSAGKSSIWIKYKSGIEGGVAFNPAGTRGGPLRVVPSVFPSPTAALRYEAAPITRVDAKLIEPGNVEVESKRVLILSPFLDEFGDSDEGATLKALYDRQRCPSYSSIYLSNGQVGVGALKALGSYGIVHIASHGAVNKERVVIYTKSSSSPANVKAYRSDLQKGRLTIETITGRSWLAATPTFFTYYVRSFPSSLIFFSSCFSAFNDSMWTALRGRGAKAYLGFSHAVPSPFAFAKSTYFHREWLEDPLNMITTGDVFNDGCSGPACWALRGAGNLEAPSSELQNGGFESGALGAWVASGDGRVITQLGQFGPVEGSFLGVVSTGLGFATQSGAIEQEICLPAGAKELEFSWNFSSEEFVEWCGSVFQDTFRVEVVTDGGTQNLFDRGVDNLCNLVGVSNLTFDQSGAGCVPTPGAGFGTGGNDCKVWTTGWKRQSIDISEIVMQNLNKPVAIRFSAGDVGDSIFDSAVLIDDIRFTGP